MVAAASGYASGPEGAADIDVVACLDLEFSKASDPRAVGMPVCEDQDVGAGERWDMLEWGVALCFRVNP